MTGWPIQSAWLIGLVWVFVFSATSTAFEDINAGAPQTQEPQSQIKKLLSQHCLECHNGEMPKGKLNLQSLKLDFENTANRAHWSAVVDRVQSGEMPPKGQPRLKDQDQKTLTTWLTEGITRAETQAQTTQGRVVLRRLNRVEYENTIRDLLGIPIQLKGQLPPDGMADGFDNAGAANHTSSFLMEKYLEAADASLKMAISNRPKPLPSTTKRHSLKDGHPVRGTTENVYRFLENGEVVCFCSSEWHNVGATQFWPNEGGLYRWRISASAFQSKSKPVTFRMTTTGTTLTGKAGLIGYFDATPDKPAVIEFVRYMEPRTTVMLLPYGLTGANIVNKVGGDKWDGPGLAVQYIDVEGPLNPTWPPQSHQDLFGKLPQKIFKDSQWGDRVEVVSEQPRVDAEKVLMPFLKRAFRRKVTSKDAAPYLDIVQSKIKSGYTFEQAMRAALKGVLISPEFLFLREKPGKLDDFALASRLSYFLWSTMPDEILFNLAEQGTLNRPDILRQQVERMLGSPRAVAFTENFMGQWLGLREIDSTEPSHLLYPEFDHLLKVSMIREVELFFEEVLKNDLSITNFVSSDFLFLNGRLAKHYGIPGVEGWEFQKKPVPPGSHRGGVLTMGGILKVTSNGTTTSPVMRGAWVLDRILGSPPPPPPSNVSALDPDIRGAKTIREQLAKHRSIESCGVCHKKIDPPGFALESFDCIGGWRDHYRVTGNGGEVIVDGRRMPYHKGKKVDPGDMTADGASFENIDQFKDILLKDKTRLARALTTKLITYATGKAPGPADQKAVETIVQKNRSNDFGLRSLIHEIVQSDIFQSK